MKKILKSILIATASIGTIAGSVATVVSCGSSTPNVSENQKKYEDQVSTVLSNVGSTGSHIDLKINDSPDIVKGKIKDAINLYISTNASSLSLLGAISDISAVTLTENGPTTNLVSNDVTNSVTVTIPAATEATEVTPKASQATTLHFTVLDLTPQEKYIEEVRVVMNSVGTVDSHIDLKQNMNLNDVKTSIGNATDKYIRAHFTELSVIERLISLKLVIVANGPDTSTITSDVTAVVTITFPVKNGIQGVNPQPSDPTTLHFTVTA